MGRRATFYLFDKLLILLTVFFFAVSCACRHAASVDPAQHPGWILFALATPGMIVINLVALAWWLARRRWLTAAVPLAALLVNLPFLAAMVQLRSHHDEAACDLKVATYNVHGFRGEEGFRNVVNQIAALLQEQQADVVCLQEFRTTIDYDTAQVVRLLGLPYAAYDRSVAVLSRYPIAESSAIHFGEERVNTTNGALQADIATPGGRVRIFACHLQTTGVSSMEYRYAKDYGVRFVPFGALSEELARNTRLRAQQASEISRMAENSPHPVILAGDFNDIPSTYTYGIVARRLDDTFREGGSGWGGTYRRALGVLRLDYIFVSEGLLCPRCYTLDTGLSDHKPVFAALNFKK